MITCQEKLQKLRDNEKQLRVEDHEIRKVKVIKYIVVPQICCLVFIGLYLHTISCHRIKLQVSYGMKPI